MGMGSLNSFQGLLYTSFFFFFFKFTHFIFLCSSAMSLHHFHSVHGIMEQDVCASVSFMSLYVALSITFFCSAGGGRMEFIYISDHFWGIFTCF